MKIIEQITIIGTGKVATHLASSFLANKVHVSHIFGRNPILTEKICKKINAKAIYSFADLPKQLTIICVSDDAILEVVKKIEENIPIAYTSGSVQISSLPSRKDIGVFYPLQTFTKEREVNFFEVPIFIESNNEYFTQTLFDLAWKISRKVKYANSEERSKLHLAAVFVNNFTNHIIYLAQEYCKENNVDFQDLEPLLLETIEKLKSSPAIDNQTGPAKRGDLKTIDFQKKQLEGKTLEIYTILTESIINTYKK